MDTEGPWQRSPDVVWRWLTEGVLVLGADADDPLLITGPAAAFWELLEVPVTATDAAARLAHTFDADEQVVADDLEPTISRLAAERAIEAVH